MSGFSGPAVASQSLVLALKTQLAYTQATWAHLQSKKDWTNVLHVLVLMSLAQSNAAVLPPMQCIHVSKDTGLICS